MRYLLKLYSGGMSYYHAPHPEHAGEHCWQPYRNRASRYPLPEVLAFIAGRIHSLTEGQQLIIIAVKEGSAHGKE